MTQPKVVILCGGAGTRLREETEYKPKPMVAIGDKPILWHIMKIYSAFGFNDFVLCLGYKGDIIRNYFLNYDLLNSDFTIELGAKEIVSHATFHDEHRWLVTLAETDAQTMTGGRVKRIQQYIDGDTFMLTYGDGVSDIDIEDLLRFHHEHGRIATVTAVHPTARFGELTLDGELAVSFGEKPQTQEGWVNGGFFVFNRKVFDYLGGDDCVLEREPLERLAAEGQLAAYRHTGYWQHMDTLRDMELLNSQWAGGSPPWAVWLREQHRLKVR
jgi:glucose-1-phosphate cytidylyltransferase